MQNRDHEQLAIKEAKAWLLEPGNNFCAMPFIHMAIEATGDIRPCCMGKPLEGMSIIGSTVAEQFRSPIREEFVEKFRNNSKPAECSACWKDPFIRAKFSTSPGALSSTINFMNTGSIEKELIWLEIKPGNRCNLKCRICGVHNSSAWAKDANSLRNFKFGENVPFKESEAFQVTQAGEWIEDENFWTQLSGFESIEFLHFMGGEPFMVPEHFQMLEHLVAMPHLDTSRITLAYNTNGTYFPSEENLELYKNFKKVHMSLSIDDFGPRFEYQRKLAEWDQVKENLRKFALLGEDDKFFVNLDPTVSNYNIFYMAEIWNEFTKLGFRFQRGGLNHFVFTGPDAIINIPVEMKKIITDKYEYARTNTGLVEAYTVSAIDYMNSQRPNPEAWSDFINKTMHLDSIRKESFEQTFPEMHALIKGTDGFKRQMAIMESMNE